MILGLTGVAGSGKDSAFKRIEAIYREDAYLRERFPKGVRRIAFADALKRSAMATLGFKHPELTLWSANRLKDGGIVTISIPDAKGEHVSWMVTGREFFQYAGYEGGRQIHGDDVWVDAALPLDAEYDPDELLVVTDTRFPNEADRIHDLGSTLR